MTENVVVQQTANNIVVTEEVNDVTVSALGVQGPQGPQGEQGITGPMGPEGQKGDKGDTPIIAYTHEQQANSYVWTIQHNLGYNPAAFVTKGDTINYEGTIEHLSASVMTITFSEPIGGFAYLS